MTRDEAIKYLIKPVVTCTVPSKEIEKQVQAYEMAIEALKQKSVVHAHWIFIGNESPLYTHKCSNCGEGKVFHSTIEMRLSNEFCSCCGAWMYGEVNDA